MKIFLQTITTTTLIAIASISYGQTEQKEPANYYKTAAKPKYGAYVLGGISMPYTDVKTSLSVGYSFGLQGLVKATYFLDAGLDVQIGKLSAGDKNANQVNQLMKFENNIMSATAVARLSPLKFLKSIPFKSPMYYFSNIYIGTGVGLLKSSVKANQFNDPSFVYIGDYTGTSVFLPVEFGLNLPVFEMKNNSSINLSLNYRFCFVMDDKIDGYVTPVVLNDRKDVYNVLNIGVGYRW